MAHESSLGRDKFVEWARELQLDEAKFLADFDDPKLSAQVAEDVRLAAKVGILGTPAFFVNGRYIRGFKRGALSALVTEELAAADKLVAEGTARKDVVAKLMENAIPERAFPN